MTELIASRQEDLQLVTKTLKGVTSDLEKNRAELRFDDIIGKLEVPANLIQELKTFRQELGEEDQSLFDRAAAIAELVDDLRRTTKQYEITKRTLKVLGAQEIAKETIRKLGEIEGRSVRGEGRFLDLVKKAIGDAFTDGLRVLVLEHAEV